MYFFWGCCRGQKVVGSGFRVTLNPAHQLFSLHLACPTYPPRICMSLLKNPEIQEPQEAKVRIQALAFDAFWARYGNSPDISPKGGFCKWSH